MSFKKKSAPTPVLSLETLEKLESLFKQKNWKIENVRGISLYDRFCNTLLNLSMEEQWFLIEITERFRKIDSYIDDLQNLAYNIRCKYPDSNLIFVPCLPEGDIGKVKSSGIALYEMETTSYKNTLGKHYIEKNNIANIKQYIPSDAIVVLVDDFIGTGETALAAVAYVHKVMGEDISNDKIKCISVVAQQVGIEALNAIGVDVFSSFVEKKGISDFYTGSNLTKAKALMESIEKKMKNLEGKFKFGYMQSESLVCMKRCPNNTFPIYWYGKDTAPYERR